MAFAFYNSFYGHCFGQDIGNRQKLDEHWSRVATNALRHAEKDLGGRPRKGRSGGGGGLGGRHAISYFRAGCIKNNIASRSRLFAEFGSSFGSTFWDQTCIYYLKNYIKNNSSKQEDGPIDITGCSQYEDGRKPSTRRTELIASSKTNKVPFLTSAEATGQTSSLHPSREHIQLKT